MWVIIEWKRVGQPYPISLSHGGNSENPDGEVCDIGLWWILGEGSAEMMVENVLKVEQSVRFVLAVGKSMEGIFPVW